MESIQQRLLLSEDDFLSAIVEGEDAIEAFSHKWASLYCDIESALNSNIIDEDLASMINATSSRIVVMAEAFRDFFVGCDQLGSGMMGEVEDILSRLSVADVCPSTVPVNAKAPSHRPPVASFMTAAYSWLVTNLHNPYPSTCVKRKIAENHGTTLARVSQWFRHIRDEIGWTALRIARFHGSRVAVTNAAFRAYVTDDSRDAIPSDLLCQFLDIKSAALELATRYTYTSLDTENVLVSDVTCNTRLASDVKEWMPTSAARKSYNPHPPSPDATPCISPVPSLVSCSSSDESDDDNNPLAGSIPSHKRSAASLYDYDDTSVKDGSKHWRSKRLRTSMEADNGIVGSTLSPSRSDESGRGMLDALDGDFNIAVPAFPCSAPAPTPSALSQEQEAKLRLHDLSEAIPIGRKRRLTDAAVHIMPKRPRGIPAGPRLHAVSDPLPSIGVHDVGSCFSLDTWPNLDFNLPEPASTSQLDVNATLDIELFTDWASLLSGAIHECSSEDGKGQVQQADLPVDLNVKDLVPESLDMSTSSVPASDSSVNILETVKEALPVALPLGFDTTNGPFSNHFESPSSSHSHVVTAASELEDMLPIYPSLIPDFSDDVVAVTQELPRPDTLAPYLSLSETKSFLATDMSSALQLEHHSLPPDFQSSGAISFQWDDIWNFVEQLPEITVPPSPFCRSSKIENILKEQLEMKVSESVEARLGIVV